MIAPSAKTIFFSLVVVGLCDLSCFRQVEETRQIDSRSAIVFVGNIAGKTAVIDGQAVIDLSAAAGASTRYMLEPGTHRVVIRSGDEIIVEREIFVGDGQTFEVEVP